MRDGISIEENIATRVGDQQSDKRQQHSSQGYGKGILTGCWPHFVRIRLFNIGPSAASRYS